MMHTALAGLLAMQHAPVPEDDEIALYMGSDFAETLAEINCETMRGGLSRARLIEMVAARAFVELDLESLAHCVAEVVAPLVPLARNHDEVDVAINVVGEWLSKLAEDDVFDRIVELKRQANEVGLDDGPADTSPEAVEAWNELFDAFCEECDAGQVQFEIGGRDVLITVEADCTILIVEREPGSADLEVLVLFQHSMGGGDDGDDDGEPEPEPEPDPARPVLIDA